jgi:hypothetical protein
MSNEQKHYSLVAPATSVEQHINQIVYKIMLLKNDALPNSTGDYNLYLGLNSSISNGNYIVLQPGEFIKDWEYLVTDFYYKSSGSSVPFRILGSTSRF